MDVAFVGPELLTVVTWAEIDNFYFTEFSPPSNVIISWCHVSTDTNGAHPWPDFASVMRVRVKQATGHDSTVPKVPGSGVGSADKYTVNGRGTTGKRVSWQDPVESCTV